MSANDGKKASVEAAKPTEIGMTAYVRESLDKVAVSEGFVNYEIDFNSSSTVGDGFIGIMFKAMITENESDKKLEVIVKSPPTNQERRHQFGAMEMFEREVYVYTNILKEFTKFQEEKNIEPEKRFTQFPKCFFAEFNAEKDESIVIMEDLKERDFVMCNKAVPASFEHAKLVFAALGRFHALSYAFKAKKPEAFETYKKLKDFLAVKLYGGNMVQTMSSLIDQTAETFEENETDSKSRVLKLKDDFKEVLIELCDSDNAEPFTVLGHGDCWSNNFMYKFQVSLHFLATYKHIIKTFHRMDRLQKSFCWTGRSFATYRRLWISHIFYSCAQTETCVPNTTMNC